MIKVHIKKLNDTGTTGESKIPTRANESDAGYDLYSTQKGIIPAKERKVVKTGIAIAIPPGYYGCLLYTSPSPRD